MSRQNLDPARCSGFTYIECLAALTIIGLAIVAANAVFVARPGLEAGIQAREEATRALQLALETARAGAMPLVSSEQSVPLPPDAAVAARSLTVTLRIRPLQPAGLFEVRGRAHWLSAGRGHSQELLTMVWRRP